MLSRRPAGPSSKPSGRVDARLDALVLGAAGLAGGIGLMVLTGWWLHLEPLTRLSGRLATMKPTTAFCVLIGSVLTWASRRQRPPTTALTIAGAGLLVIIGTGTLAEHATGLPLGFDDLLAHDYLTRPPSVPGRMSIATSVMVILTAISATLLRLERWRAAQLAAITALGLAGFALIGTAYGAIDLYALPGFSTVSLLTSVSFTAISTGLLLTISARARYDIVASLRPGSVLARQLWLPHAVVVIGIGAVVENAQSHGLLGPRADSAVFAMAVILLTSGLFWTTGRRLNQLDDGLRESNWRYRCLSECMQAIVDADRAETLLERIREVLVQAGGFEQAWIATVSADGQLVWPTTSNADLDRPDALVEISRTGAAATGLWRGKTALTAAAPAGRRPLAIVAVQLTEARDALTSERRLLDQVAETLASGLQRMTAEAQVRASEARFAGILTSAMDGIVSVDRNQRIVIFNRGAEQMFGWRYAEVAGQPLDRLIPTGVRLRHAQLVAEFGRTGVTTREMQGLELRGVRADGSEFPIEASISKVADGADTVYTAIIRDVTAQRRSADEIRQLASTLEQRVAERTAQLEAVNRELEAFSYSVSHDLRAPLRSMDGFAQAVIEDYGDRLPAEGLRFLDRIREGAKRLGQLVDDLLALSRLGRQSLVRRDVDMERLVRDCLAELNPPTTPAVNIIVGPLAHADADSALVRQVWINLLENALKFSRPAAAPRVEVGSVRQEARVTWYVRDNGVGFDMTHAAQLFGVFQRLHHQHEFEGTGVGLAIVDRIVQRHGGQVWAESRPGEGATFFFTLAPEVLS